MAANGMREDAGRAGSSTSSPSVVDLIDAFDWSSTSLGPISGWPRSLRSAVGVALDASFPMLVTWGTDFVQVYNDAYVRLIGRKHPRALGQSTPTCFPEVWKQFLEPLFTSVMHEGRAVAMSAALVPIDRVGFVEELYFTFSYSPLRADDGHVGGIFAACTDVTESIINERRMRALRDLATVMTGTGSLEEVASAGAEMLGANRQDVPFVFLYLVDDQSRPRLHASVGCSRSNARTFGLFENGPEEHDWPIADLLQGTAELKLHRIRVAAETLDDAPWPEPVVEAALIAIPEQRATTPAGVLVVGLSPRLHFDARYEQFLRLAALQLGQGLATSRARDEAQKRALQLAELDRAKTTFFSNISHEFRTPMTLMLGPLEGLLATSKSLSSSQTHDLQVAYGNCVRLRKLVDALLEFSRVEAGRHTARFEPIDLAASTAELGAAFGSAMELAKLHFTVDCPPLSAPVFVDRSMWERVVLNLLSNAMKFTLAGEVAVSLAADGGSVRLLVRDTGVGIDPDDLGRIFERFFRGKHAGGRTIEGSGIGLALVKDIVELHGGTIAVESQLGAGTTFCVTLPLGADHLPADAIDRSPGLRSYTGDAASYVDEALRWIAPRGVETPSPRAPRGVVLVVDDNAEMRGYVGRLLGDAYHVLTAADVASALEIAEREKPDLVVADRMMAGLDGLELLRALRERVDTQTTPVIILSAQADEEARVAGLRAGADEYLAKPFVARELIARIESQITLAGVRRRAEVQERTLRAEVERAKESLAKTLASISDSFVSYDREWRFTYVNDRAEVHLGHRREALIGRRGLDVFPEEAAMYRELERMVERGEPAQVTIESARGSRWYDVRGYPSDDGLSVFFTDATDRKRVEETLQKAHEELERRVQERTAELVAAEKVLRDYTHRLTQLSRQLLATQESERRRIAQDLHDEIGQALTLVQLELQVAHDATSDGETSRALEGTVAIVESVLRQVRDLSLELRPSMLDDLGLAPALRWYIDRVRQSSGLAVAFHVAPELSSGRWTTELETACFRVAQEAISNVIRHAYAGHIDVSLRLSNDVLRLSIRDDGVGFDFDAARTTAAHGTSMGLLNMEERMKLVGGRLSIASAPGRGTLLEATAPIGENSSPESARLEP